MSNFFIIFVINEIIYQKETYWILRLMMMYGMYPTTLAPFGSSTSLRHDIIKTTPYIALRHTKM